MNLSHPTIGKAISEAVKRLKNCGIETANLDASVLLAHTLGTKRENLLLEPEKSLNSNIIAEFNKLVARRAKNEPIAYITGKKEFWSFDFIVSRDTLIP